MAHTVPVSNHDLERLLASVLPASVSTDVLNKYHLRDTTQGYLVAVEDLTHTAEQLHGRITSLSMSVAIDAAQQFCEHELPYFIQHTAILQQQSRMIAKLPRGKLAIQAPPGHIVQAYQFQFTPISELRKKAAKYTTQEAIDNSSELEIIRKEYDAGVRGDLWLSCRIPREYTYVQNGVQHTERGINGMSDRLLYRSDASIKCMFESLHVPHAHRGALLEVASTLIRHTASYAVHLLDDPPAPPRIQTAPPPQLHTYQTPHVKGNPFD
jgi:hypothetical protein